MDVPSAIQQENSRYKRIFYFIHIQFLIQNDPEARVFPSQKYPAARQVGIEILLSSITLIVVVDYLLERFERGRIYTWIGFLLLAINPNGEISTGDNYDPTRVDEPYDDLGDGIRGKIEPHIFAMAARARYRIVEDRGKPSQVIVLNGETGTGKTFNARRALEFLTAENASSADEHRGPSAVRPDLAERIANIRRLISAFTTVPAEENRISSRHVELVWLEYNVGRICGATVSSYFLDRDRVTMAHSNFQIFNQMMTALTDIEFADTGLSRNARNSTSRDPYSSIEERQLVDDFRDTLKAMDTLGFTKDQKKNIFQVLSLLIHMNDIRFAREDDCCRIDIDDHQSKGALENTCKLAGLRKEDVAELLTSTLINPQSSRRRYATCRRNFNTEDACRYRLRSIVRYLYDLLFNWLIDSVNKTLTARLFNKHLGILDTFGFENFDTNGIEQLRVNYINERLQQYFLEKSYLEFRWRNLQEGLIENVELPGVVRLYEDRLNTIEKRLFASLNDVSLSTVPSDSSALIRQVCANGCPETRRFLKVRNSNFVIRHYVGDVEYSVNDLLSKNMDKIPDEITLAFDLSKNTFLHSLIVNKSERRRECHGKARKPTILSKLRNDVDSLMRELNKCDAHYVCCVKPRRLDGGRGWDRDELLRQVTNAGIQDVLPLARCKYPIHFAYKEFFKRYDKRIYDFRADCKKLSLYYGKHFIFLTEHTFLQLESARKQFHIKCVGKIESFWIKYRNNRRQNINNYMTHDVQTINNENETIEKSQPKRERIISLGISLSIMIPQKSIRLSRDSRAIVNLDDQDEVINKLRREFNVPLIDYSNIQKSFSPLNISYNKTAYINRWLQNVNKSINTKVIRSFVSKKSLVVHNQFNDTQDSWRTRSSSNNLHAENKHEYNIEDYNEKEDTYVIRYGISTLFYKNGILSRRRPARLPIRVHTRLTCLTNSHCPMHTELPRGLQDCL